MRLALAILFMAVQAQAATLYVSTTGSHRTNAPAFSTWTTAATNIQAAINASSAGDTVLVAPGIYNEFVTINKNNLTIQGGNGTLFDADRTIIDRQGVASSDGVTFSAATNSTLRGVTVMGTLGYGIFISGISNAVDSVIVRGTRKSAVYGTTNNYLRNSIVVGNYESDVMTGANVYNIVVQNCVIEANAGSVAGWQMRLCRVQNSLYGYSQDLINLGGNVTNNTTNSVMRLLNISQASDGIGTNLVWAGVGSYIPRIGSVAQGAGVGLQRIETLKSGDGGPTLFPVGSSFLGRDSSTNTYPVSLVSSLPTDPASPFGPSVVAKFDGVSNFARTGARLFSTTNFCMEGWVKFGNDTATGIFGVGGYLAGGFILTKNSSRGLYIEWGAGGANYRGPSAAQSSNVWRHLAVVSSNGVPFLYINGATQSLSGAGSAALAITGEKDVFFSYRPQGTPFYANQWLSDVRLWNYAKSDFSDRSNRLTGSESGLLGYWRLDETETPFTTGPFNIRNPTLQPSFMEAF